MCTEIRDSSGHQEIEISQAELVLSPVPQRFLGATPSPHDTSFLCTRFLFQKRGLAVTAAMPFLKPSVQERGFARLSGIQYVWQQRDTLPAHQA